VITSFGKQFRSSLRLATARFGIFAAVLMMLVLRLGPMPVSAGPSPADCSQDCITSIGVDPHGTFANFHIVTTGTAKTVIDAYAENNPNATSGMFNLGGVADWHTYLLNLTPNTKYIYSVKSTDAQGHTHIESGSFKTLHRQVTVTFKDIHVIDDSDSLSAGDFIFWFNTNGTWDTFIQFPSNGEMSVSSGQTVHPNYTKTSIDPPASMKIGVYAWDDDCDFGQFCTEGIGPGGAEHGSDSEMDWATAKGTIDTTSSGLGEVETDSFSISTTQWQVKFSASGTYKISYVP
jgi:hypothetical protein